MTGYLFPAWPGYVDDLPLTSNYHPPPRPIPTDPLICYLEVAVRTKMQYSERAQTILKQTGYVMIPSHLGELLADIEDAEMIVMTMDADFGHHEYWVKPETAEFAKQLSDCVDEPGGFPLRIEDLSKVLASTTYKADNVRMWSPMHKRFPK
jgi:hypothetical protein